MRIRGGGATHEGYFEDWDGRKGGSNLHVKTVGKGL